VTDPSDDDLDALLAGGRLSGPARDRIFDKVAAEVAQESRPRARRRVWTVAMVAAGAAAVLIVAPRLMTTRTPDGFRAKGGAPGLQLDVACTGGTLGACPQGATLTFGAAGAPGSGVLSAYAEPLEPGHERIWYFSAEGESPLLTVGDGTAVARRAIRVGNEHAPGRYRVHVFLTPTPVSRTVLLAGGPPDALARLTVDLQVAPAP
jgi:hypothetical protein